tara:strand:- start:868 stop:1098 length:231 start_codon:yes stop_codon:yes gene_type:complete
MFPFPGKDLSHSVRDGYAERREAVEHGDMDLEIRNVVAEIPRHEVLSQQLHAMHPLSDRALRSNVPRGFVPTRLCR